MGPSYDHPGIGLASNTTLGLTILAIVTGTDHLNDNLAEISRLLELFNLS